MIMASQDCCRVSFRQFALSHWGMRSDYLATLCPECRQGEGLVLDFSEDIAILGFTVDDLEVVGRKTGFRPKILRTRVERQIYLAAFMRRSQMPPDKKVSPNTSGNAWHWQRQS